MEGSTEAAPQSDYRSVGEDRARLLGTDQFRRLGIGGSLDPGQPGGVPPLIQ